FSGIWLAFIGFFLLQAAKAEARHGAARRELTGALVRNLMTPNPVSVESSSTLGEFMENVAWGRQFATYPVLESGQVIGLLVLQCALDTPRQDWDRRSVVECMIPRERVPVLAETETAESALAKLAATRVNRGLVFDGDELIGLISISDLARAAQPRRA
ncbi:MAG: CBS domain-containing protein, partial [Gaiellales bacterium]